MSCWNPKIEMMPRDELNQVQLKYLRAFAHKLYDNPTSIESGWSRLT